MKCSGDETSSHPSLTGEVNRVPRGKCIAHFQSKLALIWKIENEMLKARDFIFFFKFKTVKIPKIGKGQSRNKKQKWVNQNPNEGVSIYESPS